MKSFNDTYERMAKSLQEELEYLRSRKAHHEAESRRLKDEIERTSHAMESWEASARRERERYYGD